MTERKDNLCSVLHKQMVNVHVFAVCCCSVFCVKRSIHDECTMYSEGSCFTAGSRDDGCTHTTPRFQNEEAFPKRT